MHKYNEVTPEIISELKTILPEKYVLHGDRDALEPFSRDEVAEKSYHHFPDVVVRPRTADEIVAIMKLANREKIPVTPRGAGTGLSGGAIPIHGGIVLLTDRMNSIIEIDTENMVAVVEPGVITNDINVAAEEHGLWFAGYPLSLQSCFIGGNVSENAGGGKAVKYGVTGRYILGLEMVTPEGEIISLGGKLVKNVTGYDLVKLLVGSEGTLGIFTKIIVKLMPLPRNVVDLLVSFRDAASAIRMVPVIMTQAKVVPAAVEFMDLLSVKTACEFVDEKLPFEGTGAMLLIELDGNSEAALEEEYEQIGALCMENGALDVFVADTRGKQEKIWNVRRNIAEAFKAVSPEQSVEDITVPIARIPDVMPVLEKLSQELDIQAPCYGHAADGNLHVTLVKNPKHTSAEWEAILPQALEKLYEATGELGGVISGEHGIGHKRKKYLGYSLDENSIELMKRIKRAFDPNNILNPGKIFDI
ncbi:MAG: FAD-binding oxidoreductase [Planctomycetota bacterium]|jgi:glycolate oxidase